MMKGCNNPNYGSVGSITNFNPIEFTVYTTYHLLLHDKQHLTQNTKKKKAYRLPIPITICLLLGLVLSADAEPLAAWKIDLPLLELRLFRLGLPRHPVANLNRLQLCKHKL